MVKKIGGSKGLFEWIIREQLSVEGLLSKAHQEEVSHEKIQGKSIPERKKKKIAQDHRP